MVTLDKEALPKEVSHRDVGRMTGEHLYWFCTTCRKWRTTLVKPDGVIVCPTCGNGPDWEKHPPTLAYRSRYKRVAALCAEGSDFKKSCDKTEMCYSDFIDSTYEGLPRRAQYAGWRHFASAWKMLDEVADYLLTARDTPKANIPYAYAEDGLRRRYFRPKRKHNTATLSNIRLKREDGDGGLYSDEEAAEMMSYRAGFSAPFFDQKPMLDELLCDVTDGLEREIARDFAQGATKRDVQRTYGLSEGQVRTIVRHIAKQLNNAQG